MKAISCPALCIKVCKPVSWPGLLKESASADLVGSLVTERSLAPNETEVGLGEYSSLIPNFTCQIQCGVDTACGPLGRR